MYGKIALEECWAIPENFEAYDPNTLAPPGVIGGNLTANLLDVHDQRLRQMDENSIDLMVLSLSSSGVQGVTDPTKAASLAVLANDRLEAEILKNPTRFAGFAALSMHDPQTAADELTRCMTSKTGFVGAMLNDFQAAGPDGNTMLFYDQPHYDVFWRAAADLNASVYIHPRASTPLIHEQMWAGRPWLEYSALGYANRVNMHVLGIICSGVLDRFPKLKLLMGHMGEHIPYDLYRIDHKLNRARFPDMPMRKDKLVSDYFGTQVFITTSGHFSTPALECAVKQCGAEAVMFSVDYPFESIPNGCVWFDEHVDMNARDKVKIGRNNALAVLPKLMEKPHGLKMLSPAEAGEGGLGLRKGNEKEAEFGMYNKSWDKRMKKVVQQDS
ncbi:2-amino-3-carboxymuconate-6-semialdehyde decarboxylase [Elsinoe australis]|uniref:2-amino-3-carboxymuconate-6-semialdehyde decarboxylase n=1 Tax=Elsinoe australis TaxID=40998 RepID=A0A2P7Z3X3_9PEZI|nr:2-amino-3-carboxymuconate-6-semialdehyde decarboxylase [Elsinoe australis]